MPNYALLISPMARSAFFAQTEKVALAEISACIPQVTVQEVKNFGQMTVVLLNADAKFETSLVRLSVAQGLFRITPHGWNPVEISTGFGLHADFVSGEKYRGKTNETLTQLLLNLGLAQLELPDTARVLDPMCGRATSLLWALRYGLSGVGVELDGGALPEIHRGLKKWTKLHRQSHKLADGWVQKNNRQGVGKYLDFSTGGTRMRVIAGDTANVRDLTQRREFELIITDIPYGVQHMGSAAKRSPLSVIEAAAKGWADSLVVGGAMVIAFNAYIPTRNDLLAAFDGLGLSEVSVDIEHRMSESILRDVLILTKTK
jgi:hypothetical protein